MIPRSFTFRLIFMYSAIVALVIVAFSSYTYIGTGHYLRTSLGRTQMKRAEQIARELRSHGAMPAKAVIAKEISSLYAPEMNNRFIRITGENGTVIYVSGPPKDVSFTPSEIALPPADKTQRTMRKEKVAHDNYLYIATVSVLLKEGRYTVEVGVTDNEAKAALYGLMKTLALGFPILILITAGGGYMLMQRSLSPVRQITDSAENITLHNLEKRLPVTHTDDVFEHLSNSLNRMIARLDDSFRHISRFTADASHELRTPLTIMHMELTMLKKSSELPEVLQGRVTSAIEEAERLMHITEELFTILRLSSGEVSLNKSVFDVSELISTTIEQILPLAEANHLQLELTAEPHISLYADAARIKQIVVNLLDNAIKYTPKGGKVTTQLSVKGGNVIIKVSDTGIGIAAESLPYVFDRFYRADKARSRDSGGAGLGLAIVRSLCVLHEGTVSVQSEEGKGSVFTVELPLS